jgi:hypothetical protein
MLGRPCLRIEGLMKGLVIFVVSVIIKTVCQYTITLRMERLALELRFDEVQAINASKRQVLKTLKDKLNKEAQVLKQAKR